MNVYQIFKEHILLSPYKKETGERIINTLSLVSPLKLIFSTTNFYFLILFSNFLSPTLYFCLSFENMYALSLRFVQDLIPQNNTFLSFFFEHQIIY